MEAGGDLDIQKCLDKSLASLEVSETNQDETASSTSSNASGAATWSLSNLEVSTSQASLEEKLFFDLQNQKVSEEDDVTEVSPEGPVRLTPALISTGISLVGPLPNSPKLAFIKFEAVNQSLQNIDILRYYIHLQVVDLSENNLESLEALCPLTYLKVLNVAGNQLTSLDFISSFCNLQVLNVSNNKLADCPIPLNHLISFKLNNTGRSSLAHFAASTFPNLLHLELRGNLITSLNSLALPKLVHLYVAENPGILDFRIGCCPKLKKVHARSNAIVRLQKLSRLPSLEYLNLRDNAISDFKTLEQLSVSRNLRALILTGNPISKDPAYRSKALSQLGNHVEDGLIRLDKTVVKNLEKVATTTKTLLLPSSNVQNELEQKSGRKFTGKSSSALGGIASDGVEVAAE